MNKLLRLILKFLFEPILKSKIEKICRKLSKNPLRIKIEQKDIG